MYVYVLEGKLVNYQGVLLIKGGSGHFGHACPEVCAPTELFLVMDFYCWGLFWAWISLAFAPGGSLAVPWRFLGGAPCEK